MNFIFNILFLLISFELKQLYAYRWTVFEDENINVCNDQKCINRNHSVCSQIISKDCKKFSFLRIDRNDIKSIINGHNGLRNRVANNNFKPASNMNLLHWDYDLQRMSMGWLTQCIHEADNCKFICKYKKRSTQFL